MGSQTSRCVHLVITNINFESSVVIWKIGGGSCGLNSVIDAERMSQCYLDWNNGIEEQEKKTVVVSRLQYIHTGIHLCIIAATSSGVDSSWS